MVYIGIIWNTVNDFKEEIISDINNFGKIMFYHEIDLGDNYNEFVKELYKGDGISSWKVDLKLSSMNESKNRKVVITFIDMNDSKKVFNERKQREVIEDIENLKNYIRSKYGQKITNYYFDNVFHMTDNIEELKSTLGIIKKWSIEAHNKYENINKSNVKLILERGNDTNENQ